MRGNCNNKQQVEERVEEEGEGEKKPGIKALDDRLE